MRGGESGVRKRKEKREKRRDGLGRPFQCAISRRSSVDALVRTGVRGDGDRLGSGCVGGAAARPALSLRLYCTTNSDIISLDVTTATANLDSR